MPGDQRHWLPLVELEVAPWLMGLGASVGKADAQEGHGWADVQEQDQKSQKAGSQEGAPPGEKSERIGEGLGQLHCAKTKGYERSCQKFSGGADARKEADGSSKKEGGQCRDEGSRKTGTQRQEQGGKKSGKAKEHDWAQAVSKADTGVVRGYGGGLRRP